MVRRKITEKRPERNPLATITRNKTLLCNGCCQYYDYKKLNLDKWHLNRLSKYFCFQCYQKDGKKSIWVKAANTDKTAQYFEFYKIKNHKIIDEERLFLLVWAGFPDGSATREPEGNLHPAWKPLKEYLSQFGLKPNIKSAKVGLSPKATERVKTGSE